VSYRDVLVRDMFHFADRNALWMAWNLVLAMVPAALAVALFRGRDRVGGPLWWSGLAAFVLMLPNAPYVVTDLIHLRRDVTHASVDGSVVLGVLPLYALFVAVGFACYGIALSLLTGFAARAGWRWPALRIELAVHLVVSVGVVLGRVARLNSWDALTRPADTASTIGTTLTWDKAPVAIALAFTAIWATHTILRTLYRAASAVDHGRRVAAEAVPATQRP
jgi:uncharacterized membrane protein